MNFHMETQNKTAKISSSFINISDIGTEDDACIYFQPLAVSMF